MATPAVVRIDSASRPNIKHTVRLGKYPTCTCEAFEFGTRPCKHIRIARVRQATRRAKPSAYRSVATTPTESPKPGADDSLREILEAMPVDERIAAIERMAARFGV